MAPVVPLRAREPAASGEELARVLEAAVVAVGGECP